MTPTRPVMSSTLVAPATNIPHACVDAQVSRPLCTQERQVATYLAEPWFHYQRTPLDEAAMATCATYETLLLTLHSAMHRLLRHIAAWLHQLAPSYACYKHKKEHFSIMCCLWLAEGIKHAYTIVHVAEK